MYKQVRLGQYSVASVVLLINVKEMKVCSNCMLTAIELFKDLFC